MERRPGKMILWILCGIILLAVLVVEVRYDWKWRWRDARDK